MARRNLTRLPTHPLPPTRPYPGIPGQTPPIIPGQTIPGPQANPQNHPFDPTAHLDYWRSQGWGYRNGTWTGSAPAVPGQGPNAPTPQPGGGLNALQTQMAQQHLANQLAAYQQMGGYAVPGSTAVADIAYWRNYLNTPEGQAHLASTGMTADEFMARTQQQQHGAAQNYRAEAARWAQINATRAKLGLPPLDMVPPGWDSTVRAIQKPAEYGDASVAPSAAFQQAYPGVTQSIAGAQFQPSGGAQGMQDFSFTPQGYQIGNTKPGNTKPGVTPAQQTAAETVQNTASQGFNTPQASIAGGIDPTKHLAYWQSQGWQYNPATTQWTQVGGGLNAAAQNVPADVQAIQNQINSLPLDPAFEAQRRALENQLQTTLGSIGPAREQVASQENQALARMTTDEANATQNLNENLVGRGIEQSSIRPQLLGDLATQSLRNRQDLAGQVANAYGDIAQAATGAYGDYAQGLAEALLSLANRQATSPYSLTPTLRTPRPKPRKPRRRH